MPQSNKKSQSQRSQSSQQRNPSQQSQKTKSTVGRFAHALINGDEQTLNGMALYQQGGVGSGASSNPAELQKLGITSIGDIIAKGDKAYVEFRGNGGIAAIGVFEVLGSSNVRGNWKLYRG